ncbi:PQQ-binding-like beta-propeller repeat protein [Pirellulaceae bacterium SH449]
MVRSKLGFVAKAALTASMAVGNLGIAAAVDDWHQWMGPNRDNIWRETGLLERFPASGPKVVWRTKIAGGYSGPAVQGGRVFITDYLTDDNVKVDNFGRAGFQGRERIICLDEATGKELWKYEYDCPYTISYPGGPRCTPIVEDGLVYSLGAEGNLVCLKVDSGEVVWEKALKDAYGTKSALWGYSAHPLIDGDRLLALAGGAGSHVVSLNKKTGEELWRASTAPEQGYAPPTIINAGGVRQLILCKPNAVTSVDPTDGKEYWSVPYEASNGSIIMSPVQVGDYLYVAGYSKKSLLLKLDRDQPVVEEVWRDKTRTAICPVNVQPIAVGDVIYGMDQGGALMAIRIPSGERLWETNNAVGGRLAGSETAFLVKEGDRFWLFNEKGELIIAKLTPEGYQEIDRAKVIEPSNFAFGREVVWSMPAFANQRAYIRNDSEIICIDLKK